MLRAILFDFNGVLLDDEPVHLELFQRLLAGEGMVLAEADYYERYVGFDDVGLLRAVHAAHGRALERDRERELVARKAQMYARVMAERGHRFFPGSLELLDEAAGEGLAVGVVSGALAAEIETALATVGRRHLVSVVVAADHVERGKPDPEGYRRGLAGLSVGGSAPRADETLAVEDTEAGLAAARAAGLRTLGVAHSVGPDELPSAEAVVSSLAGVGLEDVRGLLGAPRSPQPVGST